MKRNVQLISLAVLSVSLAHLSHAVEGKMGGNHEACKEDVQKFCANVEKGEGRIIRCLKEHTAELSANCKTMMEAKKERMEERRAKIKEFGEACKDDKQKFCEDVKPGEGRIIHCLHEHANDLSGACKEKISTHMEKK